ncbi:amidohydrolase/deacetylase family metallohydrolase [Listeria riparia]|uniref:Dihydroorotase n=1 Tax=Listeria riparia FSL S10-1204 TaxID=1265816 RepID=W7D1F5_9LIST|nr:amidohydrolase/deacetylase family metallohydrolase [Listeria riparia]EUJ42780.1 dihydroorotase [Listeria riparia FSL S10-1204]
MFDILIKNAKTLDGLTTCVAIKQGKIIAVASSLQDDAAEKVIDLKSKRFISAGWIDDHVHCDNDMPLYYDTPDEIGIKKGVTTIIDAGSTGADTIQEFYQHTREAKTNVYALLNISKTGIIAQNELADLKNIQKQLVKQRVAALPDFILGLKARMSKTVVGENNYIPLEIAKELQAELHNIPIMVHIGSNPPELLEILNRLDQRDVLTHCFNGKENGILDQAAKNIKNCAMDAYKRGVRFDIGHGTDSFNFITARYAKEAGITPYTLSTDIYYKNRESGPVFDLATTMEKLLVVGYSMSEIIRMVTEHPAESFRLKNKGKLEVGYDADITIFDIVEGTKELVDSNGNKEITKKLIIPSYTIVGGEIYENEPIPEI